MMKTTYTITFLLATFLLSCTGKTNGQRQQPTEKLSTVEQAPWVINNAWPHHLATKK